MSRRLRNAIALAALAAGIQACTTKQTHYSWGNYDDALYTNYKNPQDRQAFIASLKTIILESERSRGKAPPGIYAEYGYALYEEGNTTEAIVYFKKERDTWPESRAFMEKMISNAQRQPPKTAPANVPPPEGPATALEKGTS
jgi:hypothetical protein